MSQNYTDDCYAAGHVGQTDLQNMENNFTCLKSSFSGAGAPSNAVAGMLWFDTTKTLLKHRDNANSAWRGILAGSASLKLWIYANAAEDGWAIDSAVSDKVLALKGGSTYTTGGASAGSWTISGLSTAATHTHTGPSHNHKWYDENPKNQSDQTYNSAGSLVGFTDTGVKDGGCVAIDVDGAHSIHIADSGMYAYTSNGGAGNTGSGGSHSHTQDGSWRIAAAVGTLQYPDV